MFTVMWPSAVILSRWLATNPNVLNGKSVLELGAGCGLCGLVAARIIQDQQHQQDHPEKITTELSPSASGSLHNNKSVILTDFNDTVLNNIDRNILLNNVSSTSSIAKLDFYKQTGINHVGGWIKNENNFSDYITTDKKYGADMTFDENIETEQQQHQQKYEAPVDIVLAADIICKPSDAVAAANTIYDALKPGGQAVVVCADAEHRFGVDLFESECKRVGLTLDCATSVADLYDGTLLVPSSTSGQGIDKGRNGNNRGKNNMQQTCGYVEDMKLTLFMMQKP
uniref:Calmodulin-lysine N-methyltransferase n=1 Tax=Ditylum brightwellii TaxID=49249 RepID=A0A7S1YYY1_9STRA|mmetsp:Transcript_2051/g.3274  ORF Transcript_2051/g.3274 Transcript_2051/m.3274 type:complete len:283 (+) Transcript_2051:107-955(+)